MLALAMLAHLAKIASRMKAEAKKGEKEKSHRLSYKKQATVEFGNLQLDDNETNKIAVKNMEEALQ